jgi:hypothetical protein
MTTGPKVNDALPFPLANAPILLETAITLVAHSDVQKIAGFDTAQSVLLHKHCRRVF